MPLRKFIALLAILFLAAIPGISDATNLRGRLDGKNKYSAYPYPLTGAVTELYMLGSRGWLWTARYTTGQDGMYYFPDVVPGAYVLQINGRQNYQIEVRNQPYQDLPPILIQY